MDTLIYVWMDIHPLLCVFVPCIIYSILVHRAEKKNQTKIRTVKYTAWVYVFILYIFLALNVTGSGTFWDIGHYDTLIRLDEIHLSPFQSEGNITYILNIIMLMPLGFLLPLIWKSYENPIRTIAAGAGFSLLIEISQLFNRRQTDIDDLIMNTIGAAVGFILYMAFKKIFKIRGIADEAIPKFEPMIYLGLAVLGKFFLYDWRYFVNLFYY